ncbi:MAG: putative two-component system sensor kinase [Actinomycetia bacterium]|nr:putative two-component system sensor kinase [Actinomycetes bacterium]
MTASAPRTTAGWPFGVGRRAEEAADPGAPLGASELAWRTTTRSRYGWLAAAVWLFYLADPFTAMLRHPAGWQRYLGLAALVAFVLLYLYVFAYGRQAVRYGRLHPLRARWAHLAGLAVLIPLMVPGADAHALACNGYLAAAAMINLPIRQAVGFCVALGASTEIVSRIVPGWSDAGDGSSLAVILAGAAVLGLRIAFDRNKRLMEAQEALSWLAVENERARIARDLHDILGHSLTVVTIKAELAQRLLDTDPDRARAELRDVEMLARDALADVRATTQGVRGVSLPGEIAAARSALAAAHIEADLPTAADDVGGRWRELFAWTIREAVTNLVRHSGATRCTITLTPASVEIADDGSGAGPGAGLGPSEGGGQGLAGLRRRAEALGARFTAGNRTDAPGFRVLMEAPR